MILILGSSDIHSDRVRQKIEARGKQVVCFDTRTFPTQTRISFTEAGEGWIQTPELPNRIPFSDIDAVYWYCYEGLSLPSHQDVAYRFFVQQELEAALGSLWRNLDTYWVNPATAIELHRFKPHQLSILKSAGFRVPETLITNDPEKLVAFYEAHQRHAIVKPLAGSAIAHKLTDQDMAPDALSRLSALPVQCQEFIPGVDIRVHVIEDELFITEVHTDTEHYKTDQAMRILPAALPASVEDQCRRLARTLGLRLTGIDLRRTPDDEYVFFEANPSPLFMIYEDRSGLKISDCLADTLVRGGS